MSILSAPECISPVLPDHAPIVFQHAAEDWLYVVTRWPDLSCCSRWVWRIGDADWTEITLH